MGNFKPLSELSLKDNFMFGMVLRDEDVCKRFLEEALCKPIARIEFIDKEVVLQDVYLGKGVRLDMYLEDEENTRYNIEMQTADVDDLERRIRYYQAQIDRDFLSPGKKYNELPQSYIIFVCDFDCFGEGLARYERAVTMGDGEIQHPYDDGSHVLVFNCVYDQANVNDELVRLLDYIHSGDESDTFGSELAELAHTRVMDVKQDKGKEALYLKFQEIMETQRKEGLEEGREEGREEEFLRLLKKLHSRGESLADMVDMTERSTEEVIAGLNKLGLPVPQ